MVADESLSATIYWERGRLVPDDRVVDNCLYATHISGTRRPLSQCKIADNGSSATHKKTMSPAVGKRIRDAALSTFSHHYTFAAKSKSIKYDSRRTI